jgi:hypothetical protein
MLLYLLAIVVCVVCFIIGKILSDNFSDWSVLPFTVGFMTALVVFISTIVFISQGVREPIDRANIEAERDVIVYQVEHHDSFLETSRVGVNELYYTQVKEFNEKVRFHQFYRSNPWTSWYEQPFWSEIELIDYTEES